MPPTVSFEDKLYYGVNYRFLKLYIRLGLQITKITLYEKYIMVNTKLRTKAKTEFEKDFYKLMNNSVYGKSMEKVRNRINFRLITTEQQALNM